MSNKERLEALLALGYFPRELPLVFTTADFGANAVDVIDAWRVGGIFSTESIKKKGLKGKKLNVSGSYIYKIADTEAEVLSSPKRGYERRNIHVTHPIPQALLSYEFSDNWRTVVKWLCRQKYSIDNIAISKVNRRAIRDINFRIHRVKKDYIEATSDWIVATDIARFYPSIYTHSLAWAAYGKNDVKSDIGKYKGTLADRFDQLVRACNRNQTVGIPIGPETSRVLAAIISSRIDDDFGEVVTNVHANNVDRLQDDWFVGVSTLETAENVLSALTKIYREYGLDINGSKTSIDRVIIKEGESWVSELGSFLSHNESHLSGTRLREFLTLSTRLQSENRNKSVVNYALSVIENQRMYVKDDIPILESFLLKSTITSPGSMDKICRIISNLSYKTNNISKQRVKERITRLLEVNLERGNTYEALWQLYTLRGLKICVDSKRMAELSEMYRGATIPLVLLDMKSEKLFAGKLPVGKWESDIASGRQRYDWTWLLAYEGVRKGWLKDKTSVMKDPFLDEMNKRNIVFYDKRKNVKKVEFEKKRRLAMFRYESEEVKRMINTLRGFSTTDWSYDL